MLAVCRKVSQVNFLDAKDRLCHPVIFYAKSIKIASQQHSETGHGLSWLFCLNALFDVGCLPQSFSSESFGC